MLKRRAAVLLLALTAACGSGSGTDEDRGVPSGPEDAGTTDSGSSTTVTENRTTVPAGGGYGGTP